MKKTAGIALVCTHTCRVLFLEKAIGKSTGMWGFPGGTMDDMLLSPEDQVPDGPVPDMA